MVFFEDIILRIYAENDKYETSAEADEQPVEEGAMNKGAQLTQPGHQPGEATSG